MLWGARTVGSHAPAASSGPEGHKIRGDLGHLERIASQSELIGAIVLEDSPCCGGPHRALAEDLARARPGSPPPPQRPTSRRHRRAPPPPGPPRPGRARGRVGTLRRGGSSLVMMVAGHVSSAEAAFRPKDPMRSQEMPGNGREAGRRVSRSAEAAFEELDQVDPRELPSRRRDCHLMAPRCAFSRCFNRDKQGVSV